MHIRCNGFATGVEAPNIALAFQAAGVVRKQCCRALCILIAHCDEGVEAVVSLIEPIPVLIRLNELPTMFSFDSANAPEAGNDVQFFFPRQVIANIVKTDSALLGSVWIFHQQGDRDRRTAT